MSQPYPHIEEHDGRYYVRGQRVAVTSLARVWNEGRSPETIRQDFPVLTLAEVYGAITFYLDHRDLIDQQQTEDAADFAAARDAQRAAHPERFAELQQRFDALQAREASSAS